MPRIGRLLILACLLAPLAAHAQTPPAVGFVGSNSLSGTTSFPLTFTADPPPTGVFVDFVTSDPVTVTPDPAFPGGGCLTAGPSWQECFFESSPSPGDGTYTFNFSGATDVLGIVVSITGVRLPVYEDGANDFNTVPTPVTGVTTTALTTTINQDLIVTLFGIFATATWTPPGGMTEVTDLTAHGLALEMAKVVQAVAGSTGAKTGISSASGVAGFGIIAFAPAPTSTPTVTPTITPTNTPVTSATQTPTIVTATPTLTGTITQTQSPTPTMPPGTPTLPPPNTPPRRIPAVVVRNTAPPQSATPSPTATQVSPRHIPAVVVRNSATPAISPTPTPVPIGPTDCCQCPNGGALCGPPTCSFPCVIIHGASCQ